MTDLKRDDLVQGDRIKHVSTGLEATILQWRCWEHGDCYIQVDGASSLFKYTLPLINIDSSKIEKTGHTDMPVLDKPGCKWFGWDTEPIVNKIKDA